MSAGVGHAPAFPIGSGDMRDPWGLTKRELFAAMAMSGMLADSSRGGHVAAYAKDAVAAADGLLAALAEARS